MVDPIRTKPVYVLSMLTISLIFAGCLGPGADPDIPQDPVDETPAVVLPKVDRASGTVAVGLATPAMSFNFNGVYVFELPSRAGNVTGFVIEVTWDATSPLSETLDLWVRSAETGGIPPTDPTQPVPEAPLASAKGTSPLRLELPVDAIPDDRAYSILVRANSEPVGVALEQPFELHLATFKNTEFQSNWTSLE